MRLLIELLMFPIVSLRLCYWRWRAHRYIPQRSTIRDMEE